MTAWPYYRVRLLLGNGQCVRHSGYGHHGPVDAVAEAAHDLRYWGFDDLRRIVKIEVIEMGFTHHIATSR